MKKETGKIVAGAVAGAVIGGTLGVLFAPRKGSDTRAKIKETFNNLKDKVANLSSEDIQNGATYISVMENNLNNLKKALN